ncbi:Lrp/AsnC family transcriptional regulator [Nonomuraea zeae]|uniref:Lrp/AsnC family transcriptional regulator n=1 Tax=Nonomuraea zeae TaxID=1642303 RepID=A0A5S4GG06_9ACTN|nr:Lrp/AsnC family transcriptional regulator [Nonomuraea zeae]TMR31863.1 Lrp/AsnC family transcriptional regulator [Nonomuraea zeae]
MRKPLDPVDKEIVRLLVTHGRISHQELAQRVHVSRPAVHERVKRLEQDGVIRGYRAVIDWSAIDLGLCAFVSVQADHDLLGTLADRLFGLTTNEARVEECHRVTGQWCALLKVRTASPVALQQLLDDILTIEGVDAVVTTIVLSSSEAVSRASPG